MAAEGFCIMQYECKVCGDVEEIYNSRDGVTPFVMRCRKCGGESQHVRWKEDVRDPDYIPERGQRVFFSMPLELARIFARMDLRRFLGNKPPPPAEGTEEWKEQCERITENYYHNGEAPCMYTV